MQQHPPFVSVYFCNPGQYHVNLSVNFSTVSSEFQYNHPQIGMPQQPVPALEYGHVRQNAYVPFNNNAFCFPRPASSSSLLDESYSSELSTPGIASDSWSYTSPHQIYPHRMNPSGQQFNNGRLHDSQRIPFAFSPAAAGESMNVGFNPTIKTGEFQGTSASMKSGSGGCFPGKNCAII